MAGETLIIDQRIAPPGALGRLDELGIDWLNVRHHALVGQTWVLGCTNIPDRLPAWVRRQD